MARRARAERTEPMMDAIRWKVIDLLIRFHILQPVYVRANRRSR